MEKTAIITGAGKGIGRQIALELSRAGYHILLNYRSDGSDIEQLVQAISDQGVKVATFPCDVTDFEKTKEMIAEGLKFTGKLDLLVNNAGITRDKLLGRMSEADFDQVLEVNLKGCFNCIRHSTRTFMKQKQGNIINITSVIGRLGNLGQANYAASKAGVIGLTRSAARELAPYGVRVNAIAPGFIATDMTEKLPDQAKAEILSKIPLQRIGQPEEVAKLVKFIASEEANYITGQVINLDGGMVMS